MAKNAATTKSPARAPQPSAGLGWRLARFLLLARERGGGRLWELDAIRGLALVLMIIYHLGYDLVFLGFISGVGLEGWWRPGWTLIGGMFITVSGISLTMGRARAQARGQAATYGRRVFIRGLKIIGWGMVISIATWVFLGEYGVVFGILHLIGTATILAIPFLSRPRAALAVSLVIIVVGTYLGELPQADPLLVWLGVGPAPLNQRDFFPLLPWYGVMLWGVFLGQTLYRGGIRRFTLTNLSGKPIIGGLEWMGRRSLLIYLAHQPLVMGLLLIIRSAENSTSLR